MKITLTIDDNLLMRASQLTGILEQTALVKAGLKALIALESPTDLGSQRLSDAKDQFNTFQAIMEISRRCAALPIQGSCSEDEILGYNDTGTFS